MTLRVLLQQLHSIAGVTGVDIPVTFKGEKLRSAHIYEVVPTDKDKGIIIHVKNRTNPRKNPEMHRRDSKEAHELRKSLGLCSTCKSPKGSSPTFECLPCREKRKQRYQKKKQIQSV